MAYMQKYFEEFHETIKLDDENEDLRTSRDAIKNKLKFSLEEYLVNKKILLPSFFNQGSYSMGTGNKAYDSDYNYDIDVGVKFNIFSNEYPDPTELKKVIKDALNNHTKKGARIKEPCVTVEYSEGAEEKYHVDLAVYATNGQTNRGSILQLARGKVYSNSENKYWENSQPEKLIDLINSRFSDPKQQSQFKRIIRYMKRWKDVNFSPLGSSAPKGIALTVAAYKAFAPVISSSGQQNDLQALRDFVTNLISAATPTLCDGEYTTRIICYLPVAPQNDLFSRMSNKQMETFIKKLRIFQTTLEKALVDSDLERASDCLAEVFGEEFPNEKTKSAFILNKKPNFGQIHRFERIVGYEQAPENINLKGYLLPYKGQHKTAIISNRSLIRADNFIEFRATSSKDNHNANFYWRVVNTGEHTNHLVMINKKTFEEAFRGYRHQAHIYEINALNNKLAIKNSPNPLINHEYAFYTGRHWIECLAIIDGKCVGKSKPFFVNIFNKDFPIYD